jgi:hypothetical protein
VIERERTAPRLAVPSSSPIPFTLVPGAPARSRSLVTGHAGHLPGAASFAKIASLWTQFPLFNLARIE